MGTAIITFGIFWGQLSHKLQNARGSETRRKHCIRNAVDWLYMVLGTGVNDRLYGSAQRIWQRSAVADA